MSAAPDLSAVVLCYRAEDSIHLVLRPLRALLEAEGVPFELVLVANYWPDRTDRTPDIVREYATAHPNVVPVIREKRGAMGWDMRSGLEASTGRYVVVIDGDSQNPVEDVLRMYREMQRTGTPVMKGRRIHREDGLYRAAISFGYNLLFRLLFRTWHLWDINGKPKGLTRDALDRMDLHSDDWFVDAEIVLEARRKGLEIGELPVVFHDNDERASFVKPAAIAEFLGNMLAQLRRRGR